MTRKLIPLAFLLFLAAPAFAQQQCPQGYTPIGGVCVSTGAGLPIPGTSGGIPCYTSATISASSAQLGANQVVVGGGVGACPTATSVTIDGTGKITAPGGIATGSPGTATTTSWADAAGHTITSTVSGTVTPATINGLPNSAPPQSHAYWDIFNSAWYTPSAGSIPSTTQVLCGDGAGNAAACGPKLGSGPDIPAIATGIPNGNFTKYDSTLGLVDSGVSAATVGSISNNGVTCTVGGANCVTAPTLSTVGSLSTSTGYLYKVTNGASFCDTATGAGTTKFLAYFNDATSSWYCIGSQQSMLVSHLNAGLGIATNTSNNFISLAGAPAAFSTTNDASAQIYSNTFPISVIVTGFFTLTTGAQPAGMSTTCTLRVQGSSKAMTFTLAASDPAEFKSDVAFAHWVPITAGQYFEAMCVNSTALATSALFTEFGISYVSQ